MTRKQRIKSESGYYHIMIRGNERRDIFCDNEDRLRFIDTLFEKKQENKFYLHAFCLMDNHVHMMISEGVEDIAKVMKRVSVSYVSYFNKKYKRIGHLFQDRFRSEAIEDDRYVISLTKYIHQNPVKAAIVSIANEYRWSSCNSYLNKDDYFSKMLDMDTVLGLFSSNKEEAKRLYAKDMNEQSQDSFIDFQEEEIMDVEEAEQLFKSILQKYGIDSDNWTKTQSLDSIVKEFKETTHLSLRKISSIIGLNKVKINKILKS